MMNYSNMIEEKRLKKGFILATLISTIAGTFTTGINLFDRIDEKRKQSRTDKGQDKKIEELEKKVDDAEKGREQRGSRRDDFRDSLEYSGPMIQRQYDQLYARMGSRFAEGDLIAQTQLQSQIITLQGTVIKLLQEALSSGRPPDLNKLYSASEFAREGSLRALRNQYQRLLQAAPAQRPAGLLRRTSSTPTIRESAKAAADWDQSSDSSRRPQKALTFDTAGPLFCRYAEELQRTDRPLDRAFAESSPCPTCGAILNLKAGRSWRVNKEVLRERVVRQSQVVETVEDRTYLLSNRFLVKCHREGQGFACYLCLKGRDSDTLCTTVKGLVDHVVDEHKVKEYEDDPDIRSATSRY